MKEKQIRQKFSSGILTLILIVGMILSMSAVTYATTGGIIEPGLTWTLDNSGTLTISGEGEIIDNPWISYSDRITSVIIEDGITYIESYSFAYCSEIENVTIPKSVTEIMRNAFRGCDVWYVYYNGSVDEFENICMDSILLSAEIICTEIPESNISWTLDDNGTLTISGDGEIFDYPWLTKNREITSIIIKNGITAINPFAFENCTNLHSVTIPESVTEINKNAFWGCDNILNVYYGGTYDCFYYEFVCDELQYAENIICEYDGFPAKIKTTESHYLSEKLITELEFTYLTQNGILISAIYDNNNRLESISSKSIPAGSTDASIDTPTKLSYNQCHLKIFIMDDLKGFTPLCKSLNPPLINSADSNTSTVYGRITADFKDGICDKGYLRLQIEKTYNYLKQSCNAQANGSSDVIRDTVYCPDAIDYTKYAYAKFEINTSNPDEPVIKSCELVNSEVASVDTKLYASYDDSSYNSIDFNLSETSSKTITYRLSSSCMICVNGVMMNDDIETIISNYIEGNFVGTVTFVNTPRIGEASIDSKYDYVFITTSSWAIVESTEYTDSGVFRIYFEDFESGTAPLQSYLSIDTTDENMSYILTKNNKAADFDDIHSGNILLISFDVTGYARDSAFYEIEICDNVIHDTLSSWSQTYYNRECYYVYTIGENRETKYIYAPMPSERVMETGCNYCFYIDNYGRIIKFTE